MWSWLTKINPNVAIPLVVTLGGWVWAKVAGGRTTNWSRVVSAVFANFGEELLDKYKLENVTDYIRSSRKFLEDRAWQVLKKRGVPQNSTTKKLVHSAIEETTDWLAKELRDLRRNQGLKPQ